MDWVAMDGYNGGTSQRWSTWQTVATILIWFNENKETDWRVNSSATALAAYQDRLT